MAWNVVLVNSSTSRGVHMDRDPMLYKPEEAGQTLRLSRSRIFELMASGELASVTIGRSRRIPRAALEQYVERLQASGVVA